LFAGYQQRHAGSDRGDPSPTRRRAAALLGYDTDGNLLMIGGRHGDIRADGEFQQCGEL